VKLEKLQSHFLQAREDFATALTYCLPDRTTSCVARWTTAAPQGMVPHQRQNRKRRARESLVFKACAATNLFDAETFDVPEHDIARGLVPVRLNSRCGADADDVAACGAARDAQQAVS
jgi:hypothetical protein